MTRSFTRLALLVLVTLGVTVVPALGAAQDTTAPHPAHIHEGTCAELDPNPAFPLTDVAPVAPDAPTDAVRASVTTVEMSLDDILAAPHAINIHESAENAAVYIACGDITGPEVDGTVLVGLRPQNDSGFGGVAMLTATGETTEVTVHLVPDITAAAPEGTPAATPVAEVSGEEAAEVIVPIRDFLFEPAVLEIPVGTTVTWVNEDLAPHTARSVDDIFDTDILNQGESASYTFDTPGTYDYICALHPSMEAQIVVTDAASEGTPATPEGTPAADAGTASGEADAIADEDEAAVEVVVNILGLSYDQEVLEVPVGTTVTWVSEGVAPHTATSRDGVWDSGILNQGDSFSFTFEEAGTFEYFCTVHPQMIAQVVVTAP